MWNFWQKINSISLVLLPLSGLFYFLVALRKWLYELNIFKKTIISAPVIVVGNLIVGGSKKSAFVLELAELLQNQGLIVGVVSRGFSSEVEKNNQLTEVKVDSDWKKVGDEPLMIKKSNPEIIVFVSKNRVQAAKEAKKKNVDVIISDDGLQHYQLHRDLEIVLNDNNHNGLMLPAGPLREPKSRLNRVDFVIDSSQLSYQPIKFVDLFNHCSKSLEFLLEKENQQLTVKPIIYGYAGLAKNNQFQQSIANLGILVDHWKLFNDHHHYQEKDFSNLDNNAIILTTFKDAVKFEKKWFSQNQRCYYIKSNLLIDKAVINPILKKTNMLILPTTQNL